jgi:hypothetical protein
MSNKVTVEILTDDSNRPEHRRKYAPKLEGAVNSAASVRVWAVDGLPALTFSWRPEHFVYTQSMDEAIRLSVLGYHVVKGGNGWHTYVMETELEHRTILNFRRYGWSWTNDPAGAEGYARGPIYANGHRWAGLATTPEEVVRVTAIQAMTELFQELPDYFRTEAVQREFAKLVDDAVANVSPQYARPGRVASPFASPIAIITTYTPPTEEAQVAAE